MFPHGTHGARAARAPCPHAPVPLPPPECTLLPAGIDLAGPVLRCWGHALRACEGNTCTQLACTTPWCVHSSHFCFFVTRSTKAVLWE